MIRFYNQEPNAREARTVRWALQQTSEVASKAPVKIKGDSPVTIHCGGNEEHWKSRWLAHKYYCTAALACEGSESERYFDIVKGLVLNDDIPSDGIPIRKRVA